VGRWKEGGKRRKGQEGIWGGGEKRVAEGEGKNKEIVSWGINGERGREGVTEE
jgi:hypothetical protein